jgi:hypothetical protein
LWPLILYQISLGVFIQTKQSSKKERGSNKTSKA